MLRPSVPVLLTILTFGAACSTLVTGCTRAEDGGGGPFRAFPDGLVSQAQDPDGGASARSSGGGMELPDASTFVSDEDIAAAMTDEPPVIVDTGDPPAVVPEDPAMVTDDPSETHAANPADDADADALANPGTSAPEPATPAPLPVTVSYQVPVVVESPTPALVAPQIQVQPLMQPAMATSGCDGESALVVSAPLSEIALVATIPGATPPRAIVRFPDGRERVVQVGDLLGDSGAKVVLIGSGHIKLAEVTVSQPDQPTIVTHFLHLTR